MISRQTLNHKEFRTPIGTPVFICDAFVLKTKPARFPGTPRYGTVSSKKIFRHAIERNRARRLLRDWIRFNIELLDPEYDYIFFARSAILETKREKGRRMVRNTIYKVKRNQPDARTTE